MAKNTSDEEILTPSFKEPTLKDVSTIILFEELERKEEMK
jgi:hypothetical protein